MMPIRVTIVSRHDCHLCRVAYRVATQVQQDISFDLVTVDVDSDQNLLTRYSDRVPVVLVDGREALSGRMSGGELREVIKKRVGETL